MNESKTYETMGTALGIDVTELKKEVGCVEGVLENWVERLRVEKEEEEGKSEGVAPDKEVKKQNIVVVESEKIEPSLASAVVVV